MGGWELEHKISLAPSPSSKSAKSLFTPSEKGSESEQDQRTGKKDQRTRMHSSRMRTARLLTVSQHALGRRCLPGGCLAGGVCGRLPL